MISDAEISNDTAVLAVADYVNARIALKVDQNPQMAAAHGRLFADLKDRLLGFTITLNDEDLRAAVDKLLTTVDSARHGIAEADGFIDQHIKQAKKEIAGSATWYDNQIRYAAIELQHFIDFYKVGHESTFLLADVTENGEVSVGTLPEGAMPRDAYYIRDGYSCTRMPFAIYDWQNRFDLKCGVPAMTGHSFFIAFAPSGGEFWIFPKILESEDDTYKVILSYDAAKITFADGDAVPFDEEAASAAAEFVQWKMHSRPASYNAALAKNHQANWVSKRLLCFRQARDKTRLRYTNTSPSAGGVQTGCSSCAVNEADT